MTWHRRRIRQAINRRRSSGAAADQPSREQSLVQRTVDLAADKVAFVDHRRRIRRCSAYDGKLSHPPVRRAPVAAFALQLSELRALPTIEPKRRLAE